MAEADFHMTVEPCPVLQVEGWPAALAAFEAELSRQLGGVLPAGVGETVQLGRWLAIRIAPRRLWLVGEGAFPPLSMDPELGCAVALGEGRMRLSLRGRHVFDILAACVAVDWDAPQAGPGRAVQTGFHRVPVLALRIAPDACDLIVPRSFAQSLEDWVAEVATPYQVRERMEAAE
ncbi:hypothetical protein ATER59S_04589 [Aquamicrobium terrae]